MKENNVALYESIGKNIKELRKIKKLGQEDLANLTSLSRSSISNIEIGKHQPSIQTIYEICLAFDCKILDILPSIDDYKIINLPIDKEYEDILNALSTNISKRNLNIIKELLSKDDN